MEHKAAYIISDEPEVKDPQFGFGGYAKTIADLIAYKENRTPLVIGIYGPWGSGKTTLMNAVRNKLQEYEGAHDFRVCKTVWFQAWKYAETDAMLAALLEEVFKTMERDGMVNSFLAKAEQLTQRIDKKQVIAELSKFVTRGIFDVTKFFSESPHRGKLGFYDTFQSVFDDLLFSYLVGEPKVTDQEPFSDRHHGVLVVFIDDLDRCPKSRVINVLETIKLFMDKTGCVFVIGAAREVIESALRETYKGEGEAEKFMDKIVQVTFTLPKVPEQDIKTFISAQASDNPVMQDFSPVIAQVLNYNIRAVKRFLNNMNLMQNLAINADLGLWEHPHALMRWSILEYAYPRLAKLVKENSQYVQVMTEKILELENKGLRAGNWNVTEEILKEIQIPDPLIEFLRDQKAVELVRGFPSDATIVESLVSLSTTTSVPEEIVGKAGIREGVTESKMANVPKDSFLYGDEKQSISIDKDYLIDIYPVTNEQFRHFVQNGGYDNGEVWSDDGWKWKEQERVSQPRYWDDKRWNKPDHPVVGVCWYEADAYARWTGKRLPTEQEWEKAARGTDGREYPWGNEFDKDKCNSKESGIGSTTPVTKYVNGLSPFGCYDMVGNVWEWTENWHSGKQQDKVVRGGSWDNESWDLRSSNRSRNRPTYWGDNVGFRCAQDAR